MTDVEWSQLLTDLHAIETDGDVDRAVEASQKLAELDDASRLDDLKALVETADFFVLEAIGTPIANLEGLKALPLLLRALDRGFEQGHDCDTLADTICTLVSNQPGVAAPTLLGLLGSREDRSRTNAAWLLGFTATEVGPEPLLGVLDDPSPGVRSAAVGSLAGFKSGSGVFDALVRMLSDPEEQVRVAAASSLGYFGDQRAIPFLEAAGKDQAQRVRDLANYSLELLSGSDD